MGAHSPSRMIGRGANRAAASVRSRRAARNSSVELLRILAMLMIVTSHGVMFSPLDVTGQPLSINKVLVETFLYSGGKVGVVAFFAISSWYLADSGASGLRAGLRRVWILEREVLFWSLALLGTSLAARMLGHGSPALDAALVARSLMPTVTALWWYPTAYAVFLLFLPFLSVGLSALGRDLHRALCVVMVVLWTVLDMVLPLSGVGLHGGDWMSFVYIHTLVTWWRWHGAGVAKRVEAVEAATIAGAGAARAGVGDAGGAGDAAGNAGDAVAADSRDRARRAHTSARRAAWAALAGGYALLAAGAVAGGVMFACTGRLEVLQVYLGKVEFRLPVLMVGLALFALFLGREFHSGAVNALAGSTFGVYLISEYPTVRRWLWRDGPLAGLLGPGLMREAWAVPAAIAAACVVFVACAALDQIRAALFRVTVDRRRGRWFDALADGFCHRPQKAFAKPDRPAR